MEGIGRALGRLALTIVYFVVVTPAAAVRRLLGGNPMRHRLGDRGYWVRHPDARPGGAGMRKPW